MSEAGAVLLGANDYELCDDPFRSPFRSPIALCLREILDT
jgi:hypothetical protein